MLTIRTAVGENRDLDLGQEFHLGAVFEAVENVLGRRVVGVQRKMMAVTK